MDPGFRDYSGLLNGFGLDGCSSLTIPSDNLFNGVPGFGESFMGHQYREVNDIPSDQIPSNLASTSGSNHEEDWNKDCDVSDSVLRFINQILTEEDVEGKRCMLQESLEHQALQAAEKSFCEALGQEYPFSLGPSPNSPLVCQDFENPDRYFSDNCYVNGSSTDGSVPVDPIWGHGLSNCDYSVVKTPSIYQTSQSSYSSTKSVNDVLNRPVDSLVSTISVPNMDNESESVSQFIKGVEEASKFLSNCDELIVNVDVNALTEEVKEQEAVTEALTKEGSVFEPAVEEENEVSNSGLRGRKHSYGDGLYLQEESSNKQAAVYDESNVCSDMFDKALLHHAGDKNEMVVSIREMLQNAAIQKSQHDRHSKGSTGSKGRGKKQGMKEVVDLRMMLISCAHAVAIDDRNTTNEMLKKIRQHSSPFGDGNQRLAHYFANGLQARMAGTGSQTYKSLTSTITSVSDILKAYLLYRAACPFKRISNGISNRSIAKLTRQAARIHIIDFGILYGFQWPTFIQRQSMRPGGPPKIKITGIDFPQPGFRPAERVEETGKRLAHYAEEFKVPFEYYAIAKKWELIQPEDFNLDKDEVLIVNCMYRMKNLPDETISIESSRNIVLKLIQKLSPDLFIHGVVNGAYNAPFFVTRFKEALFHFTSLFDMLETVVPHENNERMLIERDLLGKEALNVVACEGWERVERPETYKQWQARTVRAGFMQLPLDLELKTSVRKQVSLVYHKDFVVDEDGQWLLLGWKGRIIYALSTWRPCNNEKCLKAYKPTTGSSQQQEDLIKNG